MPVSQIVVIPGQHDDNVRPLRMIHDEVVARVPNGEEAEKDNNGSNKKPDRRMSQHAIPNLDALHNPWRSRFLT